MGAPAPSGVKLSLNTTDEDGTVVLKEKSYSPVSLQDATGYFDLLVKVTRTSGNFKHNTTTTTTTTTITTTTKAYPMAPLGGFGKFLCEMNVGEEAIMKVKVPPPHHPHHPPPTTINHPR